MTLLPDQIGPYEITREIGRGGMGVVYLARDTKLDRDVAIKALPEEMSEDADRLARFEREAKLLASLNHPHIATIHGLEEADGHQYLILEYIEGETLAERLARGAIPVDEALPIAKQIAEAIEAAHDKGVIHRDLKPANIKFTNSGGEDQVKVLDFGLAKAMGESAASGSSIANSPTLVSPAAGSPGSPTMPGIIMGTAGYLSPEQARGRPVDKRTDIFAFGCLLYEMLTGQIIFDGETVSDSIAATLTLEPDFSSLPTGTPRRIRDLLAHCLNKDKASRLRDAGDAALILGSAIDGREWIQDTAESIPSRGMLATSAPWLVAMAALAAALWFGAFGRNNKTTTAAPTQFEIIAPVEGEIANSYGLLNLSPDGRRVVFTVNQHDGVTRLWVRDLDDLEARPLAGTEEGWLPFWAPNNREIGFFRPGSLMRISIDGGPARTICDAADGRGGAWNREGVILFAPTSAGTIWKVHADGGEPREVTHLRQKPVQLGHRFPQFLPDGQQFIYTTMPRRKDGYEVFLASLNSSEVTSIGLTDHGATWAEPGYLLVLRDRSLLALPIDARTGRSTGDSIRVNLFPSGGTGWRISPVVSVSETGAIAFLRGLMIDSEFILLDRAGSELGRIPNLRGQFTGFRIAPDGERLAAARHNDRFINEVVEVDIERGTSTRLSTGGDSYNPIWSRDGAWVMFASARDGYRDLNRVRAGGGDEQRILEVRYPFVYPACTTPDDSQIIFSPLDTKTGRDLWSMPRDDPSNAAPILATNANESHARISPDGRWIAYLSDQAGNSSQIFIRPYPISKDDRVWQATTGGAGHIHGSEGLLSWNPEGTELIYLMADGRTMNSLKVVLGDEVRIESPTTLFTYPKRIVNFCPAPDHQSFIVTMPVDAAPGSIVVASDWKAYLDPG